MIRYSLLFTLFFPVLLSGQSSDTTSVIHRLQVGGGFGIMLHDVDFTPSANTEYLSGQRYNLSLRYFDNKLVGFQAEVGLTNAGWEETIDTLTTSNYERKISFAEVLILTQLSIGNGSIQPMLQAGPYLSLPLSETITLPEGFEVPTSTPSQYYDVELPGRLNYGAIIGLGLNVELGPMTVQLDGRYLIGFSDLFKTGDTVAATSRREGLGGQVSMFWALGK
ncbi:PorT family protein [Neolewinella aurantiaca]|uniref:PorT family protein n=1 Tax=Neolewinella aurantiaca TaxID=2602767 RepID=A0A5C7FPZ8_9BACT|nr:porin family protein [Neolewinella aurantiaca]TXF88519.1 PorT family protein [Neolewinella aurantiaca]